MGNSRTWLVAGIEDLDGRIMGTEYDLRVYNVFPPTESSGVVVSYPMLPSAVGFGSAYGDAAVRFLSPAARTSRSADAKFVFADLEDTTADATLGFAAEASTKRADAAFAFGTLAEVTGDGRFVFSFPTYEAIVSSKFAFASEAESRLVSSLFYFASKAEKVADASTHFVHISDVGFIREFLADYIPQLRMTGVWGASVHYLRPAEATRVLFPSQEMNKVIVFLRGYMLPVTITNSTAENLVDFQVPITINSLSLILQRKMREDCADIRVYDSDKVTPLPFWVEKHTIRSTATRVWVKVPTIPAGGSKTIYISYGDLQAPSLSDGVATFDFFTDFDTPLDPSFWYINANDYTISNSVLRINVGAIGLQNPLPFAFNEGYIIEGRMQYNSFIENAYSGVLETSSSRFTQGGNTGADATALYMVTSPSGNTDVRCWGATGVSPSYDIAGGAFLFYASANTWYVLGIGVTPSSLSFWKDYSQLRNYTNISWAKSMRYFALGAFHGVNNYDIKDTSYDWVRVRKFRENPPTASLGGENIYPYIRTLSPTTTEATITNQTPYSTIAIALYYKSAP